MIRLLRWLMAAYRFRRECRRAGLPRGLAGRIRQAERVAISRALLIDPTDRAAAELAGDTASARCFGDALVEVGLAKKRVSKSEVLTMAQADRPSVAKRCGQGRAGDAERVGPGSDRVEPSEALCRDGEGTQMTNKHEE